MPYMIAEYTKQLVSARFLWKYKEQYIIFGRFFIAYYIVVLSHFTFHHDHFTGLALKHLNWRALQVIYLLWWFVSVQLTRAKMVQVRNPIQSGPLMHNWKLPPASMTVMCLYPSHPMNCLEIANCIVFANDFPSDK